MESKTAAIVVIVIGAAMLLASLTADFTGLGDDAGFGNQQTIGTLAGLVVLIVGAYLYRKNANGSGAAAD